MSGFKAFTPDLLISATQRDASGRYLRGDFPEILIASEFLDYPEEMFPRYYMHSDASN